MIGSMGDLVRKDAKVRVSRQECDLYGGCSICISDTPSFSLEVFEYIYLSKVV